MITKKSKGFTIIELLVVVAIIAVLAAIVLVNVTSYINKGKDAAIKGNGSTIQVNGAVYFDTNGNYTGFNTSNGYVGPANAITSINVAPAIVLSATAYCVTAVLKDATTYCIDSTGFKGTLVSGKCTGGATPVYTCQ